MIIGMMTECQRETLETRMSRIFSA